MKSRHLIVSDSLGQHAEGCDAFAKLIPNIRVHTYEHPDEPDVDYPPGQHGAWCAWLAAVPAVIVAARNPDVEFHLHFVPRFRPNGTAYPNGIEWLLDLIEEIYDTCEPDWMGVSRSWGSWDQDNQWAEMIQRDTTMGIRERWFAVKKRTRFVDVAAAGNNDKNDKDFDVCSPQRYFGFTSAIIGARDRKGVPMEWSADGLVILGVMWGHKVISPCLDGSWVVWSGTSATCPKVAGIAWANGWTQAEIEEHFRETDLYPADFQDQRPHPKWGWGDREESWQVFYRQYLSDGYMPVVEDFTEVATLDGHPDGRVVA